MLSTYMHTLGLDAHGEDTTASIFYCWEVNSAATGVTCVTLAGKLPNPWEFDYLSEDVMARMAHRKVERYKSFKEWRTMSFIIKQYTGKALDDFDIPSTCQMRPQRAGEVRIKRSEGNIDRFVLRNEAGIELDILPLSEDPGQWNQLTVGLDSGSVGRAGAAFARHRLSMFIHVVYDIIHRIIRDTKPAMEQAKWVHRAVLRYTFLSSLNHRPFGSGAWHHDKKAMLDYFKQTLPHGSRNGYFRHWASLWAKDMRQPTNACFERQRVRSTVVGVGRSELLV